MKKSPVSLRKPAIFCGYLNKQADTGPPRTKFAPLSQFGEKGGPLQLAWSRTFSYLATTFFRWTKRGRLFS